MSKAARIRALYAEGRSTREIAAIVGCRPEYVRVAGRQRKHGPAPADQRYRVSPKGQASLEARYQKFIQRYRSDPEFRKRLNARKAESWRERYRSDPAYRERLCARMRERYRKAKRLEAAE